MIEKNLKLKIAFLFFAAFILFWQKPAMPADAVKESAAVLRPVVEYNVTEHDPFENPLATSAKGKDKAEDESVAAKKVNLKLSDFSVTGIISGADNPCAIINNEVVKVGSVIKEAKIIKIDKTGITLSYQDEEYILPAPIQVMPALMQGAKQGGSNEK